MVTESFKNDWKIFSLGMKRLLIIAPGILPFGLIMGTVASNSGLSGFEAMSMNLLVFAGASQLAALELMNNNTPIFIVVLTGFVINLRFIMYSASLAPVVQSQGALAKLGIAYTMTDQSYAVTAAEFGYLKTSRNKIIFYLGTVLVMMLVWHLSTLVGFIFGNIAPKSISLDFAVPLAFMSIVLPAIKNKVLAVVALTSAVVSLLAYSLPFNLGMIVSALVALSVGIFLTGDEESGEEK